MNTPAVTDTVRQQNAALRAALPFHDTQDFEDAERGRIGGMDPAVVTSADGRVVWDNAAYSFLEGEAPSCVNLCNLYTVRSRYGGPPRASSGSESPVVAGFAEEVGVVRERRRSRGAEFGEQSAGTI